MRLALFRHSMMLVSLILAAGNSFAQEGSLPPGSTSFCLFEVPVHSEKKMFINLGIVQYIEVLRDELRISYGGGNLGSGHEVRVPIKSVDEANVFLQRLKQTAADCQRKTP
jgi:hypothetical protein